MDHGRTTVHEDQGSQEPLGPLQRASHLIHIEGELRLHRIPRGALVLPYPVDEVLGLLLGHHVEDGVRQDDRGSYREEYEAAGERMGAYAQNADLNQGGTDAGDGLAGQDGAVVVHGEVDD